jgi:hypothetical protein
VSVEHEHRAEAPAATYAVRTALSSPSAPLDHETRERVEPLFGFDFSRLRIHSGAGADRAADVLGASAFTYGEHVVLGSGAGAQSLAHEMAHVVQQDGATRTGTDAADPGADRGEGHARAAWQVAVAPDTVTGGSRTAGRVADGARATEAAADEAAGSVLRGRPASLARTADPDRIHLQPKPAAPAERLNTAAGAREFVTGRTSMFTDEAARVGRGEKMLLDFRQSISMNRAEFDTSRGLIHSQLNDDPALYEELRAAYAQVVRAWVDVEAKRSGQTPAQVYGTHSKVIWPEGVPNAHANDLFEAVPEAERRNLRVIRTDFTLPNLSGYFATTATATTPTLPAGMAIRFGPGIPETAHIRRGLTGAAMELLAMRVSNLATVDESDRIPGLPENSTVTMVLDLRPYRGPQGAFRFTHLRHPAPRQPRGAAAAPNVEMLVEYLGRAGAEGLNPMAEAAAVTKFRAAHMVANGFGPAELQSVYAALEPIPAATLAPVDGLVFARVRADRGETAARYIPDRHTVEVYNGAFTAGDVRIGDSATNLARGGTHAVTHEIGHAVDRAPLRQAAAAADAAAAAVNRAAGTFSSRAEAENFRRLERASQAADRAEGTVRSHAGLRNVPTGPVRRGQRPDFAESAGPAGADNIAFRQAALQDSNRRLTDYSERAWEEYFAEAFSIYQHAPEELRKLRPHLFDYFNRTFPRGTP